MAASDPSALRASDAEREATAARLGEHHVAGRLDADELQERVEAAYSARTRAELSTLEVDLPGPPAPPARRALVPRGDRRPVRLGWEGPPLFLVFAVLVVASAIVHAPLVLLALPFLWARRRQRFGVR